MPDHIHIPPAVRSKAGAYWIRPLPPHWDMWMGPYETKEEVNKERAGMEITINGPEWTMMLVEMEDKFDKEWRLRLNRGVNT